MPFDSLPPGREAELREILARLEKLREVANHQQPGNEGSFYSCLWNEARYRLSSIVGFYDKGVGNGPTDGDASAELFGLGRWIWSTDPITWKRKMIAKRIAELQLQIAATSDQT